MIAALFLILAILLFVSLVVVHEWGHFIMARRGGVEVEEFGIGFPPRAKVLAKKKGTTYTLNWLPLGGFVKLKGENDDDDKPGSFGAATLGTKIKIMLAGVIMNFLAAAVIFTGLAFVGIPKVNLSVFPFYDKDQFSVASDTEITSKKVVVTVGPDSPAADAGLEDGDELISIGEERITDAAQLPETTRLFRGQTVDVTFRRDNGPEQTTQVTLNPERTTIQDGDEVEVGYIGMGAANAEKFRATWSAPIVGVATAVQYTDLSFRGLGYVLQNLFAGKSEVAGEAVGGPLAIVKVLSDVSSIGLDYIFYVIAIISISLAVMNILPIPALDGGRLFVTLLFRAIRRPLTKEREDLIHGAGFMVLIALILLVTVLDVRRFIL